MVVDARLYDQLIDADSDFMTAIGRAAMNPPSAVGEINEEKPIGIISGNFKVPQLMHELEEILLTNTPWHPAPGSLISAIEPVFTPESQGVFMIDVVLNKRFLPTYRPWKLPPMNRKKSGRM